MTVTEDRKTPPGLAYGLPVTDMWAIGKWVVAGYFFPCPRWLIGCGFCVGGPWYVAWIPGTTLRVILSTQTIEKVREKLDALNRIYEVRP